MRYSTVGMPAPVSRRQLLQLGSAALIAAAHPAHAADPPRAGAQSPEETVRALAEGNQRFASGRAAAPRRTPEEFSKLAQGQHPVAAIVGCADSRVPPEIVFDQGVGDLFVVRIAGNVVSQPGFKVQGSLEYAIAELGVNLIVVLGHTACGAIKAAVKHIADSDVLPGSIKPLVDALRPAVKRAQGKPGDLVDNAIRANVELSAERLRAQAPILKPAVREGRLKVIGGVYDLATGMVKPVG